MKKIALNKAKCTGLSFMAPVRLAQVEGNGGFLIEAYTGEPVERWWGMLAIDVDGIQAKEQIPVLMNHDTDKIVGYSTKTYREGSFFVNGKFSGVTTTAKEVKALAEEGFPWQASIGVRPLKIMSLDEGVSMEVNGKDLSGPAEVWLESEVFETSFVPLGADDKTSVATFAKFKEQAAPSGDAGADSISARDKNTGADSISGLKKKEESMKFTLEELKENAPELLADIQAKARAIGHEEGVCLGAGNERKRIQAVLAQSMPGHESVIETLAFDGKTTGPEAAVQVLAAEKKLRVKAREDLEKDGVAPVSPGNIDDDTGKEKDPLTKEAFEANVKLKNEFGDFESFVAFKIAMDKGLVKTITKGSDK